MRELGQVVRESLEEAGRTEDRPGDIYNAGAALSEEALLAFQEAVGDRRVFRKLEIDPRSFHFEIRQRYFFPPTPVRLIASFGPQATLAELFRYVGRVVFKGLEKGGGIGVWEIVNESGLGALLAKHHAVEWYRAS